MSIFTVVGAQDVIEFAAMGNCVVSGLENAHAVLSAEAGVCRISDAATCTRARIWKVYEKRFANLTFGMRGWRVGIRLMTGVEAQIFDRSEWRWILSEPHLGTRRHVRDQYETIHEVT